MDNRICTLCMSCKNDCKRIAKIKECENYVKAMTLSEYNKEIRVQNINIKRLCKEHGLKYYMMKKMLNGKELFKYKYRKILEDRIFEKLEYLPYMEGDTV